MIECNIVGFLSPLFIITNITKLRKKMKKRVVYQHLIFQTMFLECAIIELAILPYPITLCWDSLKEKGYKSHLLKAYLILFQKYLILIIKFIMRKLCPLQLKKCSIKLHYN
jgi:hypothetical protein